MPRKRNVELSDTRLANSQWPEGGRYVRQVLNYGTEYQVSNRDASARTGVNYVTISTMANGSQPEYGTIIKFCIGMNGGNINKMLRLFGYKPLEFTPDELRRHGFVPKGWELSTKEDAEYPEEEFMFAQLKDAVWKYARRAMPKGSAGDQHRLAERIFSRYAKMTDEMSVNELDSLNKDMEANGQPA